jgi:hypothetical protein
LALKLDESTIIKLSNFLNKDGKIYYDDYMEAINAFQIKS